MSALLVGELDNEELDTTDGVRAADPYHLNPVVDAFLGRSKESVAVKRIFGGHTFDQDNEFVDLDLCNREESELDRDGSADREESSREGNEVMKLILPLALGQDGRLFLRVVIDGVGDDGYFTCGGKFGGEGTRTVYACL